MKIKTIKTKVNWILNFFISLTAVFLFSAVPGFAGETVTYEGVIQGANCVQLKQLTCPISNRDGAIASERDFVLLLPGNTHYYLPNLGRTEKTPYVGKSVRVSGSLDGNKIWVTRLELKSGDGYRTVWSLEEQERMYDQGA